MAEIKVDRKPLPDLGDTKVAFAHKSTRDLLRATLLFKVIGNPVLSGIGEKLSQFALWLHMPVKGMIKATIFKQFCGGETIEESLETVKELAEMGIGTILDHSVEGLDNEEELDAVMNEVLDTIAAAKNNEHIPFCVFKPSGVACNDILVKVSRGEKLSSEHEADIVRVKDRFLKLCKAAYEADVPVLIDAEESWIQDAADEMVREMMERFNKEKAIVYNTAQIYRHDRRAFFERRAEEAKAGGYVLGMKLVRGAYMEKERERAEDQGYPSPIHANKQAVDADYDACLKYAVEHIEHVAICAGTHNEASCELLAKLMDKSGIPRDHPHMVFAQLYGMSDNISANLAHAGYNVAKYVPYGPVRKVLPYLIRRANENTSVGGQTGRELGFIMEERARRRAEGKR